MAAHDCSFWGKREEAGEKCNSAAKDFFIIDKFFFSLETSKYDKLRDSK